jgi:peptidoglycan/LPS O-acetylase OafA/YrhL
MMIGNDFTNTRKYYIDNIRSFTVVIVIIYHAIYLFNSAGVVSSIDVKGIPTFDVFCTFVYPWMMTLMFLIAGMSARYALQKRNAKQFFKERVQKLIIPLVGGIFILGWITGWVTDRYVDIFQGNTVPFIVRYLVHCFVGIGPLWFSFELFLTSLVLLLIRKIDRNDRLWKIAGKINVVILLLFVFPFWGTSYLLNTPLITTLRNGIYLFVFFAGYYLFSHDEILKILEKYRIVFFVCGLILGIIEVYFFYGENFSADACLQHPLTNLYAWIMMLGILGMSKRHFDLNNRILQYLKNRSFYWFLCHYPIMVITSYVITTYFDIAMVYNYIFVLIISLIITILFSEMVLHIPGLRFVLFGMKKTISGKNEARGHCA